MNEENDNIAFSVERVRDRKKMRTKIVWRAVDLRHTRLNGMQQSFRNNFTLSVKNIMAPVANVRLHTRQQSITPQSD